MASSQTGAQALDECPICHSTLPQGEDGTATAGETHIAVCIEHHLAHESAKANAAPPTYGYSESFNANQIAEGPSKETHYSGNIIEGKSQTEAHKCSNVLKFDTMQAEEDRKMCSICT